MQPIRVQARNDAVGTARAVSVKRGEPGGVILRTRAILEYCLARHAASPSRIPRLVVLTSRASASAPPVHFAVHSFCSAYLFPQKDRPPPARPHFQPCTSAAQLKAAGATTSCRRPSSGNGTASTTRRVRLSPAVGRTVAVLQAAALSAAWQLHKCDVPRMSAWVCVVSTVLLISLAVCQPRAGAAPCAAHCHADKPQQGVNPVIIVAVAAVVLIVLGIVLMK